MRKQSGGNEICAFVYMISNVGKLKDVGSLKYILGSKVARPNHGTCISQWKNVLRVGTSFMMTMMIENVEVFIVFVLSSVILCGIFFLFLLIGLTLSF